MLPVAEHAEALELARAGCRRTSRRSARQRARTSAFGIASFLARPSCFSTCSSIGSPWQSQPGHVRRVAARHGARLHDDVLQDLVERVAEVDVAVGVGRAVVQHEARLARRCAPGAGGRGSMLVPAPQHLRLALRQVGLHREVGARQVQRALVVHQAYLDRDGLPSREPGYLTRRTRRRNADRRERVRAAPFQPSRCDTDGGPPGPIGRAPAGRRFGPGIDAQRQDALAHLGVDRTTLAAESLLDGALEALYFALGAPQVALDVLAAARGIEVPARPPQGGPQ